MPAHRPWPLPGRVIQKAISLRSTAALTVVYFVACKLGLRLAIVHPSATAVWPGTGIALAALLLLGYRVWPGVFLGAFAVNITTIGSILSSLGIASGNTLEALAGAYLVSRFANGRRVLDRADDIFKFVFLACMLATTIGASVGTVSLFITGFGQGLHATTVWLTWWLGDMAGAILVTPCFLLWSAPKEMNRNERKLLWQEVAVASLLLTAVVSFGDFFFRNGPDSPLKFVCLPFVVWAAFELRPRAAALSMLAFSAVATITAFRAARDGGMSNDALLVMQVFLAVAALTSLLVSVAVSERNRHQQTLLAARDKLEDRVRERTQELEERIAKQERAEQEVRGLSRRLLQAQDEERRRIARDLHDSTGQSLAVLIMSLTKLSKGAVSPEVSRQLDEDARIVRDVSNELRTTSYLLHPPLLDEVGLRAGLRCYIDGFQERSQIAVSLNMDADLRFSPDVEMMVFRVVQECLTNIHRHSGSATAVISLFNSGGELTLQIRDEGKGIPPEKLSSAAGVGLRGMRERVRGFGGELDIHSDGQGTSVRAVIPLRV